MDTAITTDPIVNKNNESDEKIELSRNDLLKLLSCLEGKLQASEIVIAALKSDRIKRLFYPPIIKRPAYRNKKLNRNSLNYATIIPTGRYPRNEKEETNLNDNLETVLNTNLDDDDFIRSPTKLESNLDDLNKDFNDDESDDIKNDSLFPNDKYNEYRKELETNPYLALASDLKYAYETESIESLITKVHNARVLRVKQLIQEQRNSRKFLEEQLDELSTRYKNVVDELEVEKDKNVRFHRDETVKKLEKTEQEKKELEDELNNLKKEFESEKEREKIMIVYLLSERKQLIIRLIEESEKNTELVNLLSSEKNRSAEIEEGLEEESKRSLQMEIDLECLTNKYETERIQLEEKIKMNEKRNQELETECDKLKQKLNELIHSNNTNNNNPITTNKNLPSIEGVRSTIVTFNNAIAASSTVVNSTLHNRQIPNVVQSFQTKPSLAAKPSFDSINNTTNGKSSTVTIINTQPIRSNSIQSKSTSNKATNSVNVNNNSTANDIITATNSTSIPSTSVASVIQKFSNTISNTQSHSQSHPPIVKKLSSGGLVANIVAQTIIGGQQTSTISQKREAPPVPQKPAVNPQLLKERRLGQATSKENLNEIKNEIDLIEKINSNLDKLSKVPLTEACSKSIQNFNDKNSMEISDKNVISLEDKICVESIDENLVTIPVINSEMNPPSGNIQKKFVRSNALKSQGSK